MHLCTAYPQDKSCVGLAVCFLNRHNSSCVGLKSAYPARAKCCAWDYLRLSRASAKPFSRTPSMSALGQKQAFGRINAMSAFPKADIVQHGGDVRFVPKADIQ